MSWKLTLSYDGSGFHGWQVQPNLRTVQGTLAAAVHHITGETVLPQGSGRTDTGVHALAQVASFALAAPIPPENLQRALNRSLPASIRVLAAEIVPEHFHARHSALAKTYEYRIFEPRLPSEPQVPGEPDRICSPFLAPFVWDCRWPLNLAAMQQAAVHLLGTHDFTSFAASDPDLASRSSLTTTPSQPEPRNTTSSRPEPRDPTSSRPERAARSGEIPAFSNANPPTEPQGIYPVKTITTSALTREDGLLLYRIRGSGFLHHMVRNIVGTLVEAGRGALDADEIPTVLAARDRSAAGPTAPASGLFLVSVEYA
jgi:tRNA pseudouridine38-40 synthase